MSSADDAYTGADSLPRSKRPRAEEAPSETAAALLGGAAVPDPSAVPPEALAQILAAVSLTAIACMHELNPFLAEGDDWFCSLCSVLVPNGALLYGCRICDVDYCKTCNGKVGTAVQRQEMAAAQASQRLEQELAGAQAAEVVRQANEAHMAMHKAAEEVHALQLQEQQRHIEEAMNLQLQALQAHQKGLQQTGLSQASDLTELGTGTEPVSAEQKAALEAQYGSDYIKMLNDGEAKRPKNGKLPCYYEITGEGCRRGATCNFSHDPELIRESVRNRAYGVGSGQSGAPGVVPPGVDPNKYKKRYCKFFDSGYCVRGATCTYAHGLEELRGDIAGENLKLIMEAQERAKAKGTGKGAQSPQEEVDPNRRATTGDMVKVARANYSWKEKYIGWVCSISNDLGGESPYELKGITGATFREDEVEFQSEPVSAALEAAQHGQFEGKAILPLGLFQNVGPAPEPYKGEVPQVHLLTVGPSSQLAVLGLTLGPSICWTKDCKQAFDYTEFILREIIVDALMVNIVDDADWSVLPEVGEAIKQAGAHQSCYAVAQSPCKSCWGVGIATGWKNRATAAKLALALSMASILGRLNDISKKYPEIDAICKAAGWEQPNGGAAQVRPSVDVAQLAAAQLAV